MEYTYCQRGKCTDCLDILWTISASDGGQGCNCGVGTIEYNVKFGLLDITDEEHLVEINKETSAVYTSTVEGT